MNGQTGDIVWRTVVFNLQCPRNNILIFQTTLYLVTHNSNKMCIWLFFLVIKYELFIVFFQSFKFRLGKSILRHLKFYKSFGNSQVRFIIQSKISSLRFQSISNVAKSMKKPKVTWNTCYWETLYRQRVGTEQTTLVRCEWKGAWLNDLFHH